MSRKRVVSKNKLTVKRGGRRKAFLIIGLLLGLITASGALAQWTSIFSAGQEQNKKKDGEVVAESLAPASPSKEYVYAGSRLVATEEPGSSAPPQDPKINAVSATASNTASGFTPNAVIDGNLSSVWNSGGAAPQWVQIDLGQNYSVSRIRLNVTQSPSGTAIHQIYMGSQPQPTTLVYTFNQFTQDQQWLDQPFSPSVSGVRYVKVLTTSSPSWVAWYEIELYGTPSSSEIKINAVSVTASNTYPGFTPNAVIDGNVNNNWNSGGPAPQWIQIDLGQNYSVSRIRLNVTQDIIGTTIHQIYMGATPNPATLVYTFNQVTQEHQWLERPFSPTINNVRYVRVLTTSSPTWIAWYEIEFYKPQ